MCDGGLTWVLLHPVRPALRQHNVEQTQRAGGVRSRCGTIQRRNPRKRCISYSHTYTSITLKDLSHYSDTHKVFLERGAYRTTHPAAAHGAAEPLRRLHTRPLYHLTQEHASLCRCVYCLPRACRVGKGRGGGGGTRDNGVRRMRARFGADRAIRSAWYYLCTKCMCMHCIAADPSGAGSQNQGGKRLGVREGANTPFHRQDGRILMIQEERQCYQLCGCVHRPTERHQLRGQGPSPLPLAQHGEDEKVPRTRGRRGRRMARSADRPKRQPGLFVPMPSYDEVIITGVHLDGYDTAISMVKVHRDTEHRYFAHGHSAKWASFLLPS